MAFFRSLRPDVQARSSTVGSAWWGLCQGWLEQAQAPGKAHPSVILDSCDRGQVAVTPQSLSFPVCQSGDSSA